MGYSYLSTSRGAGNNNIICSALAFKKSTYSSLSTSRGAGNSACSPQTTRRIKSVQLPINLERGRKHWSGRKPAKANAPCIDTYLPREGSETEELRVLQLVDQLRIATYQPREGPKTLRLYQHPCFLLFVYLPIYIGRGRKLTFQLLFRQACQVQIPINLGRGRKHYWSRCWFSWYLYSYLSTSQGAGNVFPFIFPFPIRQYSSLSTSRGDGNPSSSLQLRSTAIVSISPYLPGQGRKHESTVVVL